MPWPGFEPRTFSIWSQCATILPWPLHSEFAKSWEVIPIFVYFAGSQKLSEKSRNLSPFFCFKYFKAFKMKVIREYNENTTLHGLKYTTEYGRNILERMMWGLVVLVAMIFGIYLTSKILTKWETSPIIISLDSASHPISEIPFPAVTICPTVKGIKEKVISEVCKRG